MFVSNICIYQSNELRTLSDLELWRPRGNKEVEAPNYFPNKMDMVDAHIISNYS